MARNYRHMRNVALLALLATATPVVLAQNDLPDLSTATQATAVPTNTDATSATDATTGETSATTGGTTATSNTAESTTTGETTSETTGSSTTGSTGSVTATFTGLTGLPTIAGAGVPDLVIPYTAGAPFMQKSTLPEGTVFIAVGAVLAFLGACVLLWRALVAWSISRSVKRSARAAMRGSEKTSTTWGGSSNGGGKGGKGGAYYNQFDAGSTMSLDALTSAGKPIHRSSHVPSEHRKSSAPPAGLFFSPTAQASNRVSSAQYGGDRSSSYLPAGYYASPSAEHAGGNPRASSHNFSGSLAPYARHSSFNPSPPDSPNLPASRSTSNYYGGTRGGDTSRDGLRANDGLRASSRDGYGSQRNSFMYANPSTSSLQVGTGGRVRSQYNNSDENLGGQRAPSAVLDELFENHGHGPRERF